MKLVLSPRVVSVVDGAVLLGLTSGGLFASQGPLVWYASLLRAFALIAVPTLVAGLAVTWVCERRPNRLQGARKTPALVLRGARDTAIAAWVAACLVAWPLARMAVGEPTGLVWRVQDAGGPLAVLIQNVGGILVLDAWLYWKHRLLHTKLFFGFHRAHHGYRDPTALAGFAVGPLEALLTFWPVVLLALPAAPHYAPLYFSLVVGFISFNLYLHCGVRWNALETLLGPLRFNTSSHHNRHHANAETHYAEALTIWDRLMSTQTGEGRSARRISAS